MSDPDVEHAGWATEGPGSRLRDERRFLVVRGRPSERVGGFFLLFGGLAAALLAVPVGVRWQAGRLIERA